MSPMISTVMSSSPSQCGEAAQGSSQLISDLINQRAKGRWHHTPGQPSSASSVGIRSPDASPPPPPPPSHLFIEGHLLLQVQLHHSVVVIDTVAMEMIHLSWRRQEDVIITTAQYLHLSTAVLCVLCALCVLLYCVYCSSVCTVCTVVLCLLLYCVYCVYCWTVVLCVLVPCSE